jgi:hypothetical protein
LEQDLYAVKDNNPEVVEVIDLEVAVAINNTLVPGWKGKYSLLAGSTRGTHDRGGDAKRKHRHERKQGKLKVSFYLLHSVIYIMVYLSGLVKVS